MRRRYVVGNWKMNKTPYEAQLFVEELFSVEGGLPEDVELGIAPPFPALDRVGATVGPSLVHLLAQDVYQEVSGPHTGEVSAEMLKACGVTQVIVGHSERRRYRNEHEIDLTRKIERLAEAYITPLYCVGETLGEREAGTTERALSKQMSALEAFPEAAPRGLVLAYEPVWAIGTGRSATPAMAADVHRALREMVRSFWGKEAAEKIRILYGGSVTPENAAALFEEEDIDGALLGGASLKVASFLAIARAAQRAV